MPETSPAPDLAARYGGVRRASELLCRPLAVEDYVVQSMPDVSPAKWHLAHTTWFFETFLLAPHVAGYQPYHPQYGYLFNSYYEAVGQRHPRHQRGLLSRPTVEEVYAYRRAVDEQMLSFLAGNTLSPEVEALTVLGLHHEQQHQELLVTDFKHVLGSNPLRPAYTEIPVPAPAQAPPPGWVELDGGVREVGFAGSGFAFDNEGPRHRVYLQPYRLATRPVTNGEYLEFIRAGGYREPRHWLSAGWATVRERGWEAPLYWERREGEPEGDPEAEWWSYTLSGMRPVDPAGPAVHVSYYEADAFARWAGARLPTEAEWEAAAAGYQPSGNLMDPAAPDRSPLHPLPASGGADGLVQLYGDVWEWTASPYVAYPGFRPAEGAVGEYNGKFMCGQMVLRGGSCATPADHVRPTYRNFFPPDARWQFMGLRLAADG